MLLKIVTYKNYNFLVRILQTLESIINGHMVQLRVDVSLTKDEDSITYTAFYSIRAASGLSDRFNITRLDK